MQRTRAMTKAAFETAGSHAIATDAMATTAMMTAQTTAQTMMNESDDVLLMLIVLSYLNTKVDTEHDFKLFCRTK